MNRILRLVFASVLTFTLVSVGPVSPTRAQDAHPAPTLTTPELVRLASRSIVRIEIEGAAIVTVPGFGPDAKPQEVDGYGVATGTGFVIDEEGHVVTNNHVVHPPESIRWKGTPRLTVELPKDFNPHPASFRNKAEQEAYARVVVRNGRSYLVNPPVVGSDETADLAVLQIPAGLLKPLKFARPESIEVGEDVVAIGFALSLPGQPTVTKGVVSAVGRSYTAPGIEAGDLIQTDAAVNHGNSGGPLLNMTGEVVGVNTYTLADPLNSQTQGMYLARSSRTTAPYVAEMIAKGRVERSAMGVTLRTVGVLDARALDVPEGVEVAVVEAGSAAEKAGLHAGDMILRVGGYEVHSVGDLDDALALVKTGDAVEVEYQDFGNKTQPSILTALQALLGGSDGNRDETEKEPAPQTVILVLK